jgi:hypothetical protein
MLLDFQVDYNPSLTGKDFNNNGTWGKIINQGMVVDSIKYNPNRWKGVDCYKEVLAEMKLRLKNNS